MAQVLTNKVKVNIVIEQNILYIAETRAFLTWTYGKPIRKDLWKTGFMYNCLRTIIWKMQKCP